MTDIGHKPDEVQGSRSIGRRVGGEIETVGVAPVPDDQRVQTLLRPLAVAGVEAYAGSLMAAPDEIAEVSET